MDPKSVSEPDPERPVHYKRVHSSFKEGSLFFRRGFTLLSKRVHSFFKEGSYFNSSELVRLKRGFTLLSERVHSSFEEGSLL